MFQNVLYLHRLLRTRI